MEQHSRISANKTGQQQQHSLDIFIRISPCIYQIQTHECCNQLHWLRTTYWNASMSKPPGHGYVVCGNCKLVATVEIFKSLSAEDFDCPWPTGWAAALQPLIYCNNFEDHDITNLKLYTVAPRVVRCNSTWLAAVWARPGPGPGQDSDYTGHRARVQIEQQSGNVRTIMIIAPSHWVALTSTAAAGPGDRPRRRTICTRTLNRTPRRRPGPPPQRRPAPRRAGPRPGQGTAAAADSSLYPPSHSLTGIAAEVLMMACMRATCHCMSLEEQSGSLKARSQVCNMMYNIVQYMTI